MKYKMSRSSALRPWAFPQTFPPWGRPTWRGEKCVTKGRTTKGRTMARRQNKIRIQKTPRRPQTPAWSAERNEIKHKWQKDNGIEQRGNGMEWNGRSPQKEKESPGKVGTKPMRNQSARSGGNGGNGGGEVLLSYWEILPKLHWKKSKEVLMP